VQRQQANRYTTLSALLAVLCVLLAIAGILLIFWTGSLAFMVLKIAGAETNPWTLALFKAFGLIAFFIAYLLYAAARDPVRNVAVIDALVGIMVLGAVLDIYALVALGFGALFPPWVIWTRATVRVALAVALLVLRPKTAGKI
jgi:hypothetical protein